MDTLLEIFFLPPMAIARCGSSPTPLASYRWTTSTTVHDSASTVVEPDVSLRVEADGSITPYMPSEIVFRDGDEGPIRPVAPFFELWARLQSAEGGSIREEPLTLALLTKMGVTLQDVYYEINAANRKVERRTGNPACGFRAREVINGADHVARELNAFSPHTSGQEPLVFQDRPILLGRFQVIRPTRNGQSARELKVNCEILRVRFMPPKGLVYGPPAATTGPAAQVPPPGPYQAARTQFGNIHEIVAPECRILNGRTEWSTYIMENGQYEDALPQDGYDGASVGNHQAWGCVDDSSDSLIQATLTGDGKIYRAIARVFVAPPDFAPDRRPFYSIADDIADRELDPVSVDENSYGATKAEVLDLFHRAFEVASLFNLDAERARALQENRINFANNTGRVGPDVPKTHDGSMMAADVPFVDKIHILAPQDPSRFTNGTPNNPVPYTEAVSFIHARLKNEAVLIDFLHRNIERVRRIVRPPFGTVSELQERPPEDANADIRDPRVFRDQLHDMRMPPYMRDANLHPLSLTRRQYRELNAFLDFLAEHPQPNASGLSSKTCSPNDDDSQNDYRRKIFPRNLSARAAMAARKVQGNPVATWLEDAVANCFPGLEFDVRELDCHFFPGLIFQFVTKPKYADPGSIPDQQGARLIYADWVYDPMLPETSDKTWVQDLLSRYRMINKSLRAPARWYLDWIQQGGKRLSMTDPKGEYYDGMLVWRLVRSIELDKELEIGVIQRDSAKVPKPTYEFKGWRRSYLNGAGVFDESIRAGELTQAMCNPWSHDFRDCACHYWPSNHPDVVMRRADDAHPNGTSKDPVLASTCVNWLRVRGQSSDVPALSTMAKNRLYEIDHYQINKLWETLPFVLQGREIGSTYSPPLLEKHTPYPNDGELIKELEKVLGPMELALAMQYLYALFSLRDPAKVKEDEQRHWPTLCDDLKAIRQFLLMIAVSEMTHLRWVNQMLWEIDRQHIHPDGWHYTPVVDWATQFPLTDIKGVHLKPKLRPLTPETVADFIYIERPQGRLIAAYGRCVSTLAIRPELKPVLELAVRIDGEGIDHFERFSNMQRILNRYRCDDGTYPYLRPIKDAENGEAKQALDLFKQVRESIAAAYLEEASGKPDYATVQRNIDEARKIMREFQAEAEALAERGIGIPLLNPAPKLRSARP